MSIIISNAHNACRECAHLTLLKVTKWQQKDSNLYSVSKSYSREKKVLSNFIGTFSKLICMYTSTIDHGFLEEVRKDVRHNKKMVSHHS
jgi:hypothetical protein